MPKIYWRHYAENLVAPLRRKRNGSITPKIDSHRLFPIFWFGPYRLLPVCEKCAGRWLKVSLFFSASQNYPRCIAIFSFSIFMSLVIVEAMIILRPFGPIGSSLTDCSLQSLYGVCKLWRYLGAQPADSRWNLLVQWFA